MQLTAASSSASEPLDSATWVFSALPSGEIYISSPTDPVWPSRSACAGYGHASIEASDSGNGLTGATCLPTGGRSSFCPAVAGADVAGVDSPATAVAATIGGVGSG